MKSDEYYMNIAIKEAYKADNIDEIPVGAIIVDQQGNIVARAHNNKERTNMCIGHAEINAIIKANKKNKNWRLNDCSMYVTLEPCEMCKKVINESRIKKVIYSSNNSSIGNYNKSEFIKINNKDINESTNQIINTGFKKIRNK